MNGYSDELARAMMWLAEQPGTIFLGQAVRYPGTFMSKTLEQVPAEKKIEFPVAEAFQLQFCVGLALAGHVPICIYPRQNFMLLATSELVNLLDKLPVMSGYKIVPKVIIRTASGPTRPIYPGHQHVGNYAKALRLMLTTVRVVEIASAAEALPAYEQAMERRASTLVVEHGDLYGT